MFDYGVRGLEPLAIESYLEIYGIATLPSGLGEVLLSILVSGFKA